MTGSDSEARRYHRRQLALAVLSHVVTAGVLAGWLWSGAVTALAARAAEWLGWRSAVVAIVLAGVGGSSALVTFPIEVVRGFWLPRRAGLLTQGWGGWLGDRAKMALLGGGLGLVTMEVLYALLAASPTWWWLWGGAILTTGSVALVAVVPIWIIPLFHRLTPLADVDLRARLLALAARVGVLAAEVSVADLSRKGRGANAAVVGLGRARRILVSDTLLASFPVEEIEVVLAHELAHHARGHLRQGLVVQAFLLLGLLGVAHQILTAWARPLGLEGPADPAGVPLLALVLSGLGLAATPISSAWSRRLEREADTVALDVTRTPGAFVAAMERLGALNLAERRPHRLKELLFATHPSLEERIALARARQPELAEPA